MESPTITRSKEYFFEFPSDGGICGPYISIEEMKKDSAWSAGWKRCWRYAAVPSGMRHELVEEVDEPYDDSEDWMLPNELTKD